MADVPFPPRPIPGAQGHDISITGCLCPWMGELPIFVTLGGTVDFFVMLYTTIEKLQTTMAEIDLVMDSIKHIDDQGEFLASFPQRFSSGQRIRFIVDPYWVEGRIRFTEIMRII